MSRRNVVATVLCFVFLTALAAAQRAPRPTAMEILLNLEKGFEGVNDFVATMTAEIEMERVRVPKSEATIYFKKPDKVHFSSSSFALLPREGIAVNPALLRERYDPTFMGEDTIDGKTVLKLQLAAKGATTRLRQMYLWVDPATWTIAKMETIPYEGRTLRISFIYALEQGKYWLPAKLEASFGNPGEEIQKSVPESPPTPAPQVEDLQRPPRRGSITITYSHYRVNVNLPDDLFERKETK
jgi:outer membrane lipoprotein-sorting protein